MARQSESNRQVMLKINLCGFPYFDHLSCKNLFSCLTTFETSFSAELFKFEVLLNLVN